MLRSDPNVRCCLFPGNKVSLKNESEFTVYYEITVLKGAKINRCKLGFSGPGGNGINGEADIKDAERLPPEYGELHPHKPKYATISGGTLFTVRYRYEGLHSDWSPEIRNFSVYDDLVFEQPSIEDIRLNEEKKRKNEKDEEERRKVEEATQKMCSSKFGHMCSAQDTPKQQCWKCHDWYCNYHARPNNNPFSTGGHVCH